MRTHPSYRRAAALIAAAAAAALATAAPAAALSVAPGFAYGVAAGEVKGTSAILWTRANTGDPVTLQVSTNRQFAGPLFLSRALSPSAAKDNTLQPLVTGLKAGTVYFYRFRQVSATSVAGRFRTAYRADTDVPIRFALSGDADAQRAQNQPNPWWNSRPGNNGLGAESFGIYRRMRLESNDFNVNMGDTIYSDSEVPGKGALATTLAEKWAKYKQNLALPKFQSFRASTGVYNHWDDHEFVNDFTKAEHGNVIYQAGKSAFLDYMPAHFTQHGGLGLYNHQRWGKNLEIFRLDERSFRSAKASANGTCDNPDTNQPDLAPTAPQSTRNTFALLAPSLSQPVSQACKDRINSPTRTMLGSAQFSRFISDIKKSTATFKVIFNEVPIQMFYALPYDRWEGYEAERQRLLHTLQNNGIKNTIFLTTDDHANLLNIVRYKTLESGGPQNSPYYDFTTGPVSTRTFEREINAATGNNAAGGAVDSAFFSPPPSSGGMGMPCSNVNIFSYLQVRVTSQQMKLTAKDGAAHVVKDQSDGATPCVLTLNKQ